jgi:hypothetical protein
VKGVSPVVSNKNIEAGSINDSWERDSRIDSLPIEQREVSQERARFADLCSYLAQKNVDIPLEILDELGRVRRLDLRQRAVRMKALNEELMRYLSGLGLDSDKPQ